VAALRALPVAAQQGAFFLAWTRKEASLLATGSGLGAPLDTVEVTLDPAAPARLLRLGGDAAAATGWSLRSLVPAPGMVAALVVPGPIAGLAYYIE
jgi:4'-phosphopantetheinyl transferase